MPELAELGPAHLATSQRLMADPKGFQLVVHVSAAEARRRLKGFGHGVRKIHSGGKGRAVIIHTATGEHREELLAIFDDAEIETDPDS